MGPADTEDAPRGRGGMKFPLPSTIEPAPTAGPMRRQTAVGSRAGALRPGGFSVVDPERGARASTFSAVVPRAWAARATRPHGRPSSRSGAFGEIVKDAVKGRDALHIGGPDAVL